MEIDSRLSLKRHIAGLCKKAEKQTSALTRLCETFDVPTKLVIMQTFVLRYFGFCPTVWHFCKSCDTLKIEKVQYRALKYVYVFNDFNCSYDILTRRADVPLLYTRRRKTSIGDI